MSTSAYELEGKGLHLHLDQQTLRQATQQLNAYRHAMTSNHALEIKGNIDLAVAKMPKVTIFKGDEIVRLFGSLI